MHAIQSPGARPRESVVQHLHLVLLGRRVNDPCQFARQLADFALLELGSCSERLAYSSDYRRRSLERTGAVT
jgi:hypothetical protein